MKTNGLVLLASAVIITSLPRCAHATVIFSQDFSSSSTVANYVSATPSSGQWNSISTTAGSTHTTIAVSGGALTYTRTASTGEAGTFTRSTDFAPVPAALIYKFTLSVSGNSVAQTTAATWQVGNGFSTGINAAENNYNSRFAINLGATAGTFQFHEINGGDSATFSGAQAVTWVINNSGSALSYLAPNNASENLADNKWDLWVGNTRIFDDKSANVVNFDLTDLKFAFEKGIGTITMDNFEIQAVPEAKDYGLISLFCLTGVLALQTFRSRRHHDLRS